MSRETAERRLVERGEQPCVRCGVPHNSYSNPEQPNLAASWADLLDGHPYEPVSWETMYRREVARREAEATRGTEAS